MNIIIIIHVEEKELLLTSAEHKTQKGQRGFHGSLCNLKWLLELLPLKVMHWPFPQILQSSMPTDTPIKGPLTPVYLRTSITTCWSEPCPPKLTWTLDIWWSPSAGASLRRAGSEAAGGRHQLSAWPKGKMRWAGAGGGGAEQQQSQRRGKGSVKEGAGKRDEKSGY